MISDIEKTFASGPEKPIDAFTADEIEQLELLEDGTVQQHWTDGNGLAIDYTITPEEAEDRREDGYSLGTPGQPAECAVHSVTFGGEDVGDLINSLEQASGVAIWEGLQERMLERGEGQS